MVIGCGLGSRPRAPVLQDEPVYQNRAEGIRLLAPEGWAEIARADLPANAATQDRLLVRYQRASESAPAMFEISMTDMPASANLATYLAKSSFGRPSWPAQGKPEPFKVGDRDGTRYVLVSGLGRPVVKEVMTVRRGERVYFFTGLFGANDDVSRDEFRRAVAGVTWTK